MASPRGASRGPARRLAAPHRQRRPGARRTRCSTSSSPTTPSARPSCGAGTRAPASALGPARAERLGWPFTPRSGWTDGRQARRGLDVGRFLDRRGDRSRSSPTCSRDRRPAGRSWAASACTSGRWSTATAEGEVRHAACRCGWAQAGTAAVVEPHPVRCTHFDAYRFFTPPRAAAQRAAAHPGRPSASWSSPAACTPPWTSTSGPTSSAPACPASWLPTASSSPREVRELDMRASPYDLAAPRLPAGADRDAGGGRVRAGPARVRRPGAALRERLLAICYGCPAHARPDPPAGVLAHRRGSWLTVHREPGPL